MPLDFQLCDFGRWLEFDLTSPLLFGDRRSAAQKVGNAVCLDWNESDCDLLALKCIRFQSYREAGFRWIGGRLGGWNLTWIRCAIDRCGWNVSDILVVPDSLQTKSLFPNLEKVLKCPDKIKILQERKIN